nr:hypothetical protein [uncultured Marinobacter sp.]
MKRFICFCITVSTLALALAGCGKESDELPVDGRDFDGVGYSASSPYTGKVIDGYLNHARVWLDMDGDSQYTGGAVELELSSGRTITLPGGEPTAMSGPGGVFSLDVSGLALDPAVGPDIDPRNYPLYAVALPGKTLEETGAGDLAVARAYLMSASAGVRNITPLTTLARYRGLAGLGSLPESSGALATSLAGMNLLKDYVLAGDDRAHAYARALARFMASQIPDAYNAALSANDSEGTERYLSPQAAFLLGISLVQNADEVIAVVDTAAQGNYANVDPDALVLPDVPLALSDPMLLTSQRVYAEPERTDTLPANRSDLAVSAHLMFDYAEDGRLMSVSAEGCLAPSLPELARLVGVSGYPARLDTQWLPAASLSPQSAVSYGIAGVDERLLFDWQNRRIYFETTTTCHDHEGVQAGSSELGGNPEITYSWSMQDGHLEALVAEIPRAGGVVTRSLIPATLNAEPGFPGYRLLEEGVEQAALTFTGPVETCTPDPEAVSVGQAVTAIQPYLFTGYEPQPTGFTGLALELDRRNGLNRPLRFGFLDPVTASLGRVDSGGDFEWVLYYPDANSPALQEGAENLIAQAYLKGYGGERRCGREFENVPSGVYARVSYGYQNLSDYLIGLLE